MVPLPRAGRYGRRARNGRCHLGGFVDAVADRAQHNGRQHDGQQECDGVELPFAALPRDLASCSPPVGQGPEHAQMFRVKPVTRFAAPRPAARRIDEKLSDLRRPSSRRRAHRGDPWLISPVEFQLRLPVRPASDCRRRSWPAKCRADRDHHALASREAAERNNVIAMRAGHLDRLVGAVAKYRRQSRCAATTADG